MMSKKTDEQILNDIEVHSTNAMILLNKSNEIRMSAFNLDDIDSYVAAMKKAIAFQEISVQEMQKALDLQLILSQRLNSLKHLKSRFGLF